MEMLKDGKMERMERGKGGKDRKMERLISQLLSRFAGLNSPFSYISFPICATIRSLCFSISPFAGRLNPAASLCPPPPKYFAILLQSMFFLYLPHVASFALIDPLMVSPIFLIKRTISGPSMFWIMCKP